jgi:hypothetical protein
MLKINMLDKIRWSKKAMPEVKRVVSSRKEQEKLINLLRDNGYSNIADIAEEFTLKYGQEVKNLLS